MASCIQADVLYKFAWEEFPILLFGASDEENKFHPFCLAITSHETDKNYGFCKEDNLGIKIRPKQSKKALIVQWLCHICKFLTFYLW